MGRQLLSEQYALPTSELYVQPTAATLVLAGQHEAQLVDCVASPTFAIALVQCCVVPPNLVQFLNHVLDVNELKPFEV